MAFSLRKQIPVPLRNHPSIVWMVYSLLSGGMIYLLYGQTLAGFWRYDDTQLLKHASEFSPWQFFTDPEASRSLQAFNLNPFISLSFSLDCSLFGQDPKIFYLRHLATLWLSALATVLLLRRWSALEWACLGGLFYLLGSPLAVISGQLMCRHYLEGLIFSSLAVVFYLKCLRGGAYRWALLSGLGYFAAISCKEVYVPLPVVLFFLPEGSFPRRIRAGIPIFLTGLLYIPWRHFMLGSYLGGMGLEVSAGKWLALPFDFWRYLFGPLQIPALSLALIFFALISWKNWRMGLFLLVCMAVLLGPLAPISSFIVDTDRYFLPLWWFLSLITLLMARFLAAVTPRSYIAAAVILAVLSGGALWKNSQTRERWEPIHREFDVQGRFLWDEGSEKDAVILSPLLSRNYWYVVGLDWLKKRRLPEKEIAKIWIDEREYEEVLPNGGRIWEYRPEMGKMKQIQDQVPVRLRQWNSKVADRPLTMDFRYDREEGVVAWQFGPYENGRYLIITDTGGLWELPLRGKLRSAVRTDFHITLRYDSPEGWITYSEKLPFLPTQGKSIQWHRP